MQPFVGYILFFSAVAAVVVIAIASSGGMSKTTRSSAAPSAVPSAVPSGALSLLHRDASSVPTVDVTAAAAAADAAAADAAAADMMMPKRRAPSGYIGEPTSAAAVSLNTGLADDEKNMSAHSRAATASVTFMEPGILYLKEAENLSSAAIAVFMHFFA